MMHAVVSCGANNIKPLAAFSIGLLVFTVSEVPMSSAETEQGNINEGPLGGW